MHVCADCCCCVLLQPPTLRPLTPRLARHPLQTHAGKAGEGARSNPEDSNYNAANAASPYSDAWDELRHLYKDWSIVAEKVNQVVGIPKGYDW
jgi:hypothetical protein